MSFQPLFDRVLVKSDPIQTTTPSGIVLSKPIEALVSGVVVACGPGIRTPQSRDLLPLTVGVGDRVMYPSGIGAVVVIGGEKLLLMREGDIAGKETK